LPGSFGLTLNPASTGYLFTLATPQGPRLTRHTTSGRPAGRPLTSLLAFFHLPIFHQGFAASPSQHTEDRLYSSTWGAALPSFADYVSPHLKTHSRGVRTQFVNLAHPHPRFKASTRPPRFPDPTTPRLSRTAGPVVPPPPIQLERDTGRTVFRGLFPTFPFFPPPCSLSLALLFGGQGRIQPLFLIVPSLLAYKSTGAPPRGVCPAYLLPALCS